jgi:tetratricopeptide (TPR) repeat protein
MKKTLLTLLTLLSINAWGNINYIQIKQIPNYQDYSNQFDFLFNNVQYYNHWVPEWSYDVSKKSLIQGLKDSYNLFSFIDSNNLEINLLLGDISHYLYNLQEDDFYDIAINHYEKAIKFAPDNYRPYWFMANHYALSNVLEKSISLFIKAQSILPEEEPSDFWEEYANATGLANMPSHCIYAMDKAKSLLGKPGWYESQVGKTIYDRIEPVNKDTSYSYTDIWTASEGEMISFVARPLGLRLLIDSTWNVSFYDYQKYFSFVTIVPPAISNKAGREITYTIAIIMKVAQKEDDLESFIKGFIAKYPTINYYEFVNKYPGQISYEIKDKEMYQEIGGAHMHVIGLSRPKPKYAGYLLEQPIEIQNDKSGEVEYFRAGQSNDRFDEAIYYAIMLDACEDIYAEALKVYKSMFENLIIIE